MLILSRHSSAASRRRVRSHVRHADGAGARHLRRARHQGGRRTPAVSIPAAAPRAVEKIAAASRRTGPGCLDRRRRRRVAAARAAGVRPPARPPRHGRAVRRRGRRCRDGERVSRLLGDRRGAGTRRRRRHHRSRHRRRRRDGARRHGTTAGSAPTGTALAGAVVAGHVIECGTQVDGRQLLLLHRSWPDLAPHRVPVGRDRRRRVVRGRQARRHGRHSSTSGP